MGNTVGKLVFPTDYIEKIGNNELHDTKYIATDRYKIPYVFIDETPDETRAVVLYNHGNAENLNTIYPGLKTMSRELAIAIVTYDYAGYGMRRLLNPEIKPSEENVYADALTLAEYAKNVANTRKIPFIIHGRSLGSAPALHVAVNHQNAQGLVLESAFRSVARTVIGGGFVHSVFDMFDNEEKLKQQKLIPTCFIHGVQDHIVPFSHGEYLYKHCMAPKEHLFVRNGDHNNLESTYKQEVYFKLDSFVHDITQHFQRQK